MGYILNIKTHIQGSQVLILSSTSVLFGPTTVQMPNLALIENEIDYSVDSEIAG
jgi:hypothetical protein